MLWRSKVVQVNIFEVLEVHYFFIMLLCTLILIPFEFLIQKYVLFWDIKLNLLSVIKKTLQLFRSKSQKIICTHINVVLFGFEVVYK